MRIAAHTLGCKLNFAETSDLLRRLSEAGHEIVEFRQIADLYVVNTCTVTAVAEKKCRTAIHQVHRKNPAARIAVIGCFAQNEAKLIAEIEGVSIVLGNNCKHLLPKYISEIGVGEKLIRDEEPKLFETAYSSGDRTRTFFKIQDGCDYFCTYCAIPFARGRSRSASIAETVEVAKKIALTGTKEIVLTGVNTGTFGQQRNETFIDLLKKLDEIEGISRYRISSIEPNLITDEIVNFVAKSRAFLPHFHIPMQAGSDKVLKLMHRHYDTALYAEKTEHIKDQMPDACIAADIMTGFNGETEEEWEKTKDFIKRLPIAYLHVFTYSDRPNTAALKLGEKVAIPIRKARSLELHQISDEKKHAFEQSQIGKTRTVLWESSNHEGWMYGLTDNYIRLRRPYDENMTNTVTTELIEQENIVDLEDM